MEYKVGQIVWCVENDEVNWAIVTKVWGQEYLIGLNKQIVSTDAVSPTEKGANMLLLPKLERKLEMVERMRERTIEKIKVAQAKVYAG